MENNFENSFTQATDVTPAAEAAPAAEAVETPKAELTKKNFAETAKNTADKLMNGGLELWGKMKAWNKKTWILAGSIAAAVVVAIILLATLTNTKSTPLSNIAKIANAKKFDKVLSLAPKAMNGFCESEIKNIIKIAKKSDMYKEYEDDINDSFEELVDGLKEQYGDNYKITYKITDKEKMDKDDCEDIQDAMKDMGKLVTSAVKEVKKMDDDVWEELEDQTGLKEKEMKKILDEVDSIGSKMKKAKVTAGYELEVTLILKGSELDEPEETEININVIKVNGRWIIDFVSPLASYTSLLNGLNIGSLIGGSSDVSSLFG